MNNTKERIIDEAFQLFAEKGFEASISQITKLCGITKGSFYAHFTSKEELIIQITTMEIIDYTHYFTGLIDKVNSLNNLNDEIKLKEVFLGMASYFSHQKKSLFWKRIIFFPPDEMKDEIKSRLQEFNEQFFKQVNSIISQRFLLREDREQLVTGAAMSFFGLFHALLSSEALWGNDEMLKYIDIIWEFYVNGYRNI